MLGALVRQVIIPAGTVDEHETTVLDVPAASPLEQPQRVIIPPGTVHGDETTVVVMPAPRLLASPPGVLHRLHRATASAPRPLPHYLTKGFLRADDFESPIGSNRLPPALACR